MAIIESSLCIRRILQGRGWREIDEVETKLLERAKMATPDGANTISRISTIKAADLIFSCIDHDDKIPVILETIAYIRFTEEVCHCYGVVSYMPLATVRRLPHAARSFIS